MTQNISNNRLDSLDFFRGATVAGMILVNNPGSWSHIYGPLKHADWHGWTPTDLIFPFFLFIVGVSIVLAFDKAISKGAERADLVKKTMIRALKIFGLGMILAAFPFFVFQPEFGLHPKLPTLRIMGVLQRIAVCYALASLIYLYLSKKMQWVLIGGVLLLYWLALALIPVPGYGAGALDIPEGTLAAYIDQLILGKHIWRGGLWDPEGILSTLPAVCTTLLGIKAGELLLNANASEEKKTLHLLMMGFVLLTIGYLWSWIFPINKNIWTSSYTLFTAGQAFCFLAICYWVIDVKGFKKGTSWGIAYGVNAITVFFLSGIFGRLQTMVQFPIGDDSYSFKELLYDVGLQSIFSNPLNASLAHALVWISGFYLLARWMQKRNIIIKV